MADEKTRLGFNLGYQKAHSPLYRGRYDVLLVFTNVAHAGDLIRYLRFVAHSGVIHFISSLAELRADVAPTGDVRYESCDIHSALV